MLWRGFLSLLFVSLAPLALASTNEVALRQALEEGQRLHKITVIEYGQATDSYDVWTFKPEKFRELLDLHDGFLENDYFRVVENTGDQTLTIGDFDGRNVLYHLMKARTFFVKLEPANPALNHKIIVRVRVKKAYNAFTHFADFDAYNDARYIPAQWDEKWGAEIWFHSPRTRTNWKAFALETAGALYPHPAATLIVGPLALHQYTFEGFDSAKTPSIIYHEAFHWASDRAGLFPTTNVSTPLLEDYANYFGSVILGVPQVGDLPGFNDPRAIRHYGHIKVLHRPIKKMNYNGTETVPSLLWAIRHHINPELMDRAVWSSISSLSRRSFETDIPTAILGVMRKTPGINESEIHYTENLFKKYDKSLVNLDKSFQP